jgi:hypothetical protein
MFMIKQNDNLLEPFPRAGRLPRHGLWKSIEISFSFPISEAAFSQRIDFSRAPIGALRLAKVAF